ncbi:hypothetical protein GCM10022224_083960 [Nonomuraea antimicrobica]|uniref:Uncharacterized protein n=1 Tax=Nonomuraea antimicrobica TaxID=561173 RepID=A0ABP7DH87_9ACTN
MGGRSIEDTGPHAEAPTYPAVPHAADRKVTSDRPCPETITPKKPCPEGGRYRQAVPWEVATEKPCLDGRHREVVP